MTEINSFNTNTNREKRKQALRQKTKAKTAAAKIPGGTSKKNRAKRKKI